MKKYINEFKSVLLLSSVLLIICGIIYPLVVTGISQVVFPKQANGSLIEVDGKVVGSKLIGQTFTDKHYLVGRPSAVNYNVYTAGELKSGKYEGVASGSDNFAASNHKLIERVSTDMAEFLTKHPSVKQADLPMDLFTASASGLDPHISPAVAAIQVKQLALSTGLTEDVVQDVIDTYTIPKFLGVFGEEVVNVLEVNVALTTKMQ